MGPLGLGLGVCCKRRVNTGALFKGSLRGLSEHLMGKFHSNRRECTLRRDGQNPQLQLLLSPLPSDLSDVFASDLKCLFLLQDLSITLYYKIVVSVLFSIIPIKPL